MPKTPKKKLEAREGVFDRPVVTNDVIEMASKVGARAKVATKKTTAEKQGSKGAEKPRCGLCGKTRKLTQTECCGHWICDDEDKYVLFSYARTSCSRNHRRYTLCCYHYTENHSGNWLDCRTCRKDFDTEIYVYYGTNEYNFTKLPNPPSYKPTKCLTCDKVINLGEDGYSTQGRDYFCMECSLQND